MSKTAITLIIIVIVAVLLGAVIFALQNGKSNINQSNDDAATRTDVNSANTNRTSNVNSAALNSNSSARAANEVSVKKSAFVPKYLTVSAGQKVTWSNDDSIVHYVAPDDHPAHDRYSGVWDDDGAGRVSPGETYSITISTPGTYTYHDHLNPTITGTLVVK